MDTVNIKKVFTGPVIVSLYILNEKVDFKDEAGAVQRETGSSAVDSSQLFSN